MTTELAAAAIAALVAALHLVTLELRARAARREAEAQRAKVVDISHKVGADRRAADAGDERGRPTG